VTVICNLLVMYDNQATKERVNGEFMQNLGSIIFANFSERDYSSLTMACQNVSEVDKIREWVENLDGVKKVEAGIVKEFVFLTNWMDEQIEECSSKVRDPK